MLGKREWTRSIGRIDSIGGLNENAPICWEAVLGFLSV